MIYGAAIGFRRLYVNAVTDPRDVAAKRKDEWY